MPRAIEALDVGSGCHGQDGDEAGLVINPVEDAVRTATRAVPIIKWRHQALAFAAQFVPEGVPMIREVFGFSGNSVEMLARIQAPPWSSTARRIPAPGTWSSSSSRM